MNSPAPGNQAHVDVDALMQEIRRDLAQRMGDADGASAPPSSVGAAATSAVPALPVDDEVIARRPTYTLTEFLRFHDAAFIANAYRGILGREPDAAGGDAYLERLREGSLAKVEILGRLRYSPEGRAAGVRVDGLRVPFALRSVRRIPLVGPLLGMAQYVVRLPTIVRNHERLEAAVFRRDREVREAVNAIGARLEARGRALDEQVARIAAMASQFEAMASRQQALVSRQDAMTSQLGAMSTRLEAMSTQLEAMSSQLEAIAPRLAGVEREFQDLRTAIGALELRHAAATALGAQLRREVDALATRTSEDAHGLRARAADFETGLTGLRGSLREQERRLVALLDAASGVPASGVKPSFAAAASDAREHLTDAAYVAFEDTFRGTRDDIRRRLEVYLPQVDAARARTGDASALDLGCGRGEWLELLGARGIVARGIDTNRQVVTDGRERGLDVEEIDALAALARVPDASLGIVSAFHLIEHLPLDALMRLLDEVVRVLAPGGLVILETPNPENLIVGACTFWYDLTHRHPLPPEPMRFLLRERGMAEVDILRLHPRDDAPDVGGNATDLEHAVRDRLYGPQDYALLGIRR